MRIAIMIRKTRTGYSADAPDVPGCIATAKTVGGTRRRMVQTLKSHLEMMAESGEPLPKVRQKFSYTPDPDAGEEFCTWVEVEMPQLAT